ncbi:hypothetical protein BaRGS_00023483 [Batillaria attramentaria]|uniref:Uncharacterized protein n=1 Tax=Batillaria attramentaria TaxID=370345 RepID=A0ABD0KDW4_9CAEN
MLGLHSVVSITSKYNTGTDCGGQREDTWSPTLLVKLKLFTQYVTRSLYVEHVPNSHQIIPCLTVTRSFPA